MFICIKLTSIHINYYNTKLNNCQDVLVVRTRLVEGKDFLRICVKEKFPNLPTRYIIHAINKAKSINKDHEQIVFGGKKIFEKLCKNHLQGKRREKLKEQWKQNRKYNLISIGTGNSTEKYL